MMPTTDEFLRMAEAVDSIADGIGSDDERYADLRSSAATLRAMAKNPIAIADDLDARITNGIEPLGPTVDPGFIACARTAALLLRSHAAEVEITKSAIANAQGQTSPDARDPVTYEIAMGAIADFRALLRGEGERLATAMRSESASSKSPACGWHNEFERLDQRVDGEPVDEPKRCDKAARWMSCMPTINTPTCDEHKCRCAKPLASPPCSTCGGSGHVPDFRGDPYEPWSKPCPACGKT